MQKEHQKKCLFNKTKIQVPIGVFSGVPDLENVQKYIFGHFLAVFGTLRKIRSEDFS